MPVRVLVQVRVYVRVLMQGQTRVWLRVLMLVQVQAQVLVQRRVRMLRPG